MEGKEKEKEIENSELFQMLKDKKALLRFLLDTVTRSKKYTDGLRSMKDRGFSQQGMLDKCVEVTAIQSEEIQRLAFICLIYSQSDNFSSSLAQMMIKLGASGDAVLSAMFRSKFG